jgi:hypothetical protein
MTDIVLNPIANPSNTSLINDNFDKIETVVNEGLLHLEGGNNVMKQNIDMNSKSLLNVHTDVNQPNSLLTVTDGDARYYNVGGDTLTGPMNVGGNTVSGLPAAVGATDAVRKQEFDAAIFDSAVQLRSDLANAVSPVLGSNLVGYKGFTVKNRLDEVKHLKYHGAVGDGVTDDTAALVNVFSQSNIVVDTGTPDDIYLIRHDTLLLLTGENRLRIRDGVSIIGSGKIHILSNQLADGTRIELTGSNIYVGPIELSEVNPVLTRSNVYGTISSQSASNFMLDRTRVIGSNGAAMHFRNNSQNFFGNRIYIRNTKADGWHVQRGSRDFLLLCADIRECEDDCVGIVGHGKNEGYDAPSNGFIIGGYFGEHQNGAVGSGLAFIGCHNCQASNVIIRSTGLSGIRIAEEQSQGLYTPRNITVSNADIDKTGLTTNLSPGLSKEGIFISAGYKILVDSTEINRAGTHGVSISGPNVDVKLLNTSILNSGSRGVWAAGATATGDFITEIWGDDPRGVGAVNVKIEYLRLLQPRIDRSGTDGLYVDGTLGSLVEPEFSGVKVKRSNMGNTAGKYGVFFKDCTSITAVDIDGGLSGSGTALQAATQYTGSITVGTTGIIDEQRNRVASLTIPMMTKFGKRVFWNASFPASPTGVEGGYTLGEVIRNANAATGTENWVCTAAGDPGTWAAK